MTANGQLVFTDVDKVTFKGVGDTSNAVIDTTTGKIGVGVDSPDANLHVLGNCFVSTNFELGGTMTMGTVTVRAQHELSAITATGNTTPHTVEFQNAETGLVTTGNIEVGTANLFVDTSTSNVGIGTNAPIDTLHINGGTRFAGHIIPTTNATFDIGSAENKVRDLYVDTNSIWVGDRAKIAFENGKMKFKRRKLNKVPRMLVTLAISGGRTDEADVETHAIAFAQTKDASISSVSDLKLEHLRDYAKTFDNTKSVSDIFADNEQDYEAITASEAFMEVGSNIFTEHSLSIGKTTDPTSALDVVGDTKISSNLAVGTDKFFVDTVNSRVGIGVTDPPCKLTIDGGIGVNSTGGVLAIRQKGDTINDGITLTSSSANSTRLYKDGNGHFYIHSGGSDTVFQNQTGNVGIGTASPQQKLEVHGNILLGQNDVASFIHGGADIAMSSDTHVLIVSDANAKSGTATNADIIFGAGSNYNMDSFRDFTYAQAYPSGVPRLEHMRILGSNGNVGIGTTSPSTDLQIGNTSNKTSDTYLTIASDGGSAYAQGIRLIHHGTDTSSMYGWRIRGDDTDDCFHINYISQGSQQTSALTIKNNGSVGIGTDSPRNKLEIKTTGTDSGLLHLFKTTGNGVGIDFCDQNSFLQKGFLRYHHQDSQAFGARNCFRFSTTELTETLACGGSLLIGVDGKDSGDGGNHRKNLFIQSTYNGNTSQNYGWWMGAQDQGLTVSDNDFYFSVVRNGVIKECAAIIDQNNSTINFTGQHRTFVKNTPTSQLIDKEGLIVVSDQNEFIKMSGGVAYGNDAITINESLPVVSFSNKAKDKRCFGVLSTTEDPETRKEVHGNFASLMQKEEGDTRVYVNSVGEGAVWVTNINGTLESGDYITTSNVAGYGMKQNDDILHNYTVAKILMDCDFNPVTQPKRTIRKESRMIDYWIRYGDVKITEEEYQTLPETNRKIVEDVHYRIDQMEVVKENPEKDTFVYEQREEMVNVLDEHGEFQWEDSSETEKAYKIRYLDADGNITDEANAVHTAAFVGCTYHCG